MTLQNIYYSSNGEGPKFDGKASPSILYTIQEHNEYNGYDRLYPKTHASLIVNPPQATGARIDVTYSPASSGIVVNLSGQKTASATTDSNGKCSFEGLDYGEYMVSAIVVGNEQSKIINIDASKMYDIELGISTTLNNNDWATISAVSSAGLANNYWNVGDAKTIIIDGQVGNTTFSNLSIDAYVLGINHNAEVEGNNRIHFCIGKVNNKTVGLTDSRYAHYPMTSSDYFSMSYGSYNTNGGGWEGCYMRNSVMQWIKNALPTDLQNVLKTVTKYTDNTGGGEGSGDGSNVSYVTATTETICLEAEFEIHGTRSYANSYEQNKQKQYDYYKNGNSKVRYKYNGVGEAVMWWNRSPYSDNPQDFCHVSVDGSASAISSRQSNAIALCFYV